MRPGSLVFWMFSAMVIFIGLTKPSALGTVFGAIKGLFQ